MKIFKTIILFLFIFSCSTKEKNNVAYIYNKDTIDTLKIVAKNIDTFNLNNCKTEYYKEVKLKDSTIVFYFKDLSYSYNYELIDKYYNINRNDYTDSILRIIKIFDKKDSIIQKIYINIQLMPWYFFDKDIEYISRSYITKKNTKLKTWDNYCGEIVIADLNFDGLEDFATVVGYGIDNGSHYKFYIQTNNNKFEYNSYLTENVVWFPEKINDSLMSFTSSVPCFINGLWCQTFKYDTISEKWKKIEDYIIDRTTGKLIK